MHQLHEDVLTFSVETLLFFNDPVHGYWRCWGMCALTTCPWSKCELVLPSAGLNRYRRSLELRHTLAGVDPDGFCHTHTSELLNRSSPKLMRLKSVAGCYLEIFYARHLTLPPVAENHPFSSRRRARTTSQRHKRTSPSHRPTSSTITFLIIKRTNAEANTIILPLQKKKKNWKKSRKKHSHWKEFFLPSRQIFYDSIL